MLTLYAAKNTVALAPHIALEETGLPYRIEWISFAQNEQRDSAYLSVNPKGRVPALVTDDGVITESPALLEYIADTTGKLRPEGVFARARMREMIGYLSATMHINHAHGVRGARWSDDPAAHASMVAKVPQTMTESSAFVETCLPKAGWLTGEYSLADIHLFTVCGWLAGDGVDIADFPKLAAHFAATGARAAVQRAIAAHG